MLFVDPAFLFLFLPLVILAEKLTRNTSDNTRSLILAVSGMTFYGAWSWKYLCLLLLAIICNHTASKIIYRCAAGDNKARAKGYLASAILGNLLTLGVFKYADFFLETIGSDLALNLILPLAISFYTFQQIAYVVDVYRHNIEPPSLLRYSSFVLFFPQLIAGPIVNYKDVEGDLRRFGRSRSVIRYDLAFTYLAIGLAKKLIVADPFGAFLAQQQLVMSVGETTPLLSVLTILAYGLQLYFDFSAYGDMALGLGYAFGIRLPVNFDAPYKSSNISSFWRRWHITLGKFLRDYLYIPLGGSRKGRGRTLLNLNIVMLLGGLWHGAAWGYLLWGVLHGAALTIHQVYKNIIEYLRRHRYLSVSRVAPWLTQVTNTLANLATVSFVFFAWVPFYTQTVGDAWMLWQSAFAYEGSIIDNAHDLHAMYDIEVGDVLIQIVLGLALVFFMPTSHKLVIKAVFSWKKLEGSSIHRCFSHPVMLLMYTPLILVLAKTLLAAPVAEFLYFQF